jgi:dolichol-phosphate mannosyltransferase
MDCDLQDRPEEIPRLWAKAQEGHDIVVGRRAKRQDEFFKRLFSRIFHEVIKYINNRKNDAAQSTFGIYSRRVIDKIKLLSEKPGIFPLLIQRTDFPVKAIEVEHCRRAEGKSSYTLKRKLSLAMSVMAFCSDQPLKIYVRFKIFAAVAAFAFGIGTFVYSFLFGYKSVGWTRGIFISFILSGIVFLAMGILEIYMRRIFNQLKKKTPCIVAERTQAT